MTSPLPHGWIRLWSKSHNCAYYYHDESRRSTWTPPNGALNVQETPADILTHSGGSTCCTWTRRWSKTWAAAYFYNTETGETSWGAPECFVGNDQRSDINTKDESTKPIGSQKRKLEDVEGAATEEARVCKLEDEADVRVGLDLCNEPPPNALWVFTAEELQKRRRLNGSTLSVLDRKRFAETFDESKLGLSPQDKAVWDANPHIRQVFVHQRPFHRPNRSLQPEDRIFSDRTPRLRYQRRIGEIKTVEHWGQRKLLMSEIEFLTQYSRDGDTVVYAGAAPGNHIRFLSECMFPELRFVLVDPSRFDISSSSKVEIRNCYFDDTLAAEFADSRVLFVSDIRAVSKEMDSVAVEHQVQKDMSCQMNWVQIMKPKVSMLKFRLPYTPGETTYLQGKLYLPVWGGRTTSECRLIVEPCCETGNFLTQVYDHGDYEDVMFNFNTITRTTYFEHCIDDVDGLDHCYDCAAEILILEQYVSKKCPKFQHDYRKVCERVSALSREITRNISRSGRSLLVI